MGSFQTTVNRLLRSKAEKKGDGWDLSKAFITKAEDGEEFGKIVVVDVSLNNDALAGRAKAKTGDKLKTDEPPLKVDENSALVLTLEGVGMRNVEGWFGCSDPMFYVEVPVISIDGSTKWQTFYQSEHVENNLNPQWKPATLPLAPLCNCDLDKPIRISFFDWEEDGRHNPMGYVVSSVNRLLYSKATKKGDEWDLSKALITRSEEGEEFGKIVVVDVRIDPHAGKEAVRATPSKPERKRSEDVLRSPKRDAKSTEKSPIPEKKLPVPKKSPVPEKKSPVPEKKSHAPEKKSPVPEKKSPVPEKKPPVPEKKSAVPEKKAPLTEKGVVKEIPTSNASSILKEVKGSAKGGTTLSITLEGVDLGECPVLRWLLQINLA